MPTETAPKHAEHTRVARLDPQYPQETLLGPAAAPQLGQLKMPYFRLDSVFTTKLRLPQNDRAPHQSFFRRRFPRS
jgi:hypothetical protein